MAVRVEVPNRHPNRFERARKRMVDGSAELAATETSVEGEGVFLGVGDHEIENAVMIEIARLGASVI
jgi:hypothetical protein